MLTTSEKIKVAAARLLLYRMDMAAMEKYAGFDNFWSAVKRMAANPAIRIPTAAGVTGLGSLAFTGDKDLDERLKIMALAGAGGAAAGATPELVQLLRKKPAKGYLGGDTVKARGKAAIQSARDMRADRLTKKIIELDDKILDQLWEGASPDAKTLARLSNRARGLRRTRHKIRTRKAPSAFQQAIAGGFVTPGIRIPLSALLGGGIGAGVAGLTDEDVASGALIGGAAGGLAGASPEALKAFRAWRQG
jgi:hypothetical protein